MQPETHNVVTVLETGTERTRDGATCVKQTREAFLAIGGFVQDMTARIEQTAAVSPQALASAQTVQHAISEIADLGFSSGDRCPPPKSWLATPRPEPTRRPVPSQIHSTAHGHQTEPGPIRRRPNRAPAPSQATPQRTAGLAQQAPSTHNGRPAPSLPAGEALPYAPTSHDGGGPRPSPRGRLRTVGANTRGAPTDVRKAFRTETEPLVSIGLAESG